ncbi:MAG: lipid-A-disaccharide synthase [Acidobacteriota bacterium]
MGDPDLLIVAGEASGDLHAARLLSALEARLGPSREPLRAFGLGGEELRRAGLETLADSAEISVVGIVEVAKIYRRARQIFDQLLAEVDRRGATTAILVDFPEFNLRLARELRKRDVRVVYYISPQIWAWRKGRVRTIARDVDLMLVLFPFEVDFYRQHDVEVVHVGHPLVDEVPQLEQAWDRVEAAGGIEASEPLRLAVLPGSRPSEVRALLPTLIAAAERIAAQRSVAVRLIAAPTVPDQLFDELLDGAGLPVERVSAERFRAVADSHLAFCASGTATLETALLGTPMIVVYKLKRTSYWLARWLVDLPYFCMVNLVLDRPAVPELLQNAAEPEAIARRALDLVADDAAVRRMRADLSALRPALGSSGASERAAAAVLERLGWN